MNIHERMARNLAIYRAADDGQSIKGIADRFGLSQVRIEAIWAKVGKVALSISEQCRENMTDWRDVNVKDAELSFPTSRILVERVLFNMGEVADNLKAE